MPKGIFARPIRPVIFVIGPSIAYVELTLGLFATIEVEDAEQVGSVNWHVRGHARCPYAAHRKLGHLHRFLLSTDAPQIDHVNGHNFDDRRHNLRPASNGQNRANSRLNKNNKSGFKGVSWNTSVKGWVTQIRAEGKAVYLGTFETPELAHNAYVEAARKHYGEFARP